MPGGFWNLLGPDDGHEFDQFAGKSNIQNGVWGSCCLRVWAWPKMPETHMMMRLGSYANVIMQLCNVFSYHFKTIFRKEFLERGVKHQKQIKTTLNFWKYLACMLGLWAACWGYGPHAGPMGRMLSLWAACCADGLHAGPMGRIFLVLSMFFDCTCAVCYMLFNKQTYIYYFYRNYHRIL